MPEPRLVITREAEDGAIGAGLAVVQGTAARQAKLPAAAGARAVGVTAFAVGAAGRQMAVISMGMATATASAAIAVGDPLQVAGTSGKLKKAAPSQGANANVIGYALSSAAADGEEFEALIVPSSLQG